MTVGDRSWHLGKLSLTPFAGPEVKAEFNEIKAGIAEELRASEGFKKKELLEPANRYRLALAFGIFLGQQCTGMTGKLNIYLFDEMCRY